jgi:glycosyltransferase involved in cell wall biosynthesis
MNIKKITLVVGTYKDPDGLRKTLQGFAQQSYNQFNVVIIDDNSPADVDIIQQTRSIIESYPDLCVKYIKNDINIGVPHVFRKWINIVDTEYFYISGSGDRLLPSAIELMVTFLDSHPEVSMVHGLETKGNSVKERPLFHDDTTFDPKLYLDFLLIGGEIRYAWSQMAAMFRTEFWRIKNIPITKYYYWDHYFHCNYLLLSDHIGYINEYLCVRNIEARRYYNSLGENYFIPALETKYQSLQFINENEFNLVLNGYNVNRYRRIISLRILSKIRLLRTREEIILCLKYGGINYIKSIYLEFLGMFVHFVVKLFTVTNKAAKQNE